MISEYQVGVAFVQQGSALVSGAGTSWLTYVKAGDQIEIAGSIYPIAEVIDVSTLRLVADYPGSTAAGTAYRIHIS